MEKGQKLIKDTIIYGIANFGSTILAFFMLPVYTYYFTTYEYGLWDLVLTTSTLLIPFITFELISAVYRWLLDEPHESGQKNIITTGSITIVRNLIFFNILAIIVISFIPFSYKWEAITYINVMIITNFMQQCARGLGYNKLFASLGLIQTVITIAFNLYFIFILKLRVETLFYSAIIAGLCIIIIAWRFMEFGKYISFQAYSKQVKKDFLKYSLPIIPGAASWWVMTMSDRYFIITYLGVDYNGIFAIANKIPALLLMINNVFFLAWKDSAILEFKSNDKNEYYSKVFQTFFRFMATIVIFLILISKPIIAIFISKSFYDSWQYIGVLLCASLLHTIVLFWSAGFHGARKTKVIFTTSLIGAIINIIVNFILIERLQLYAVAISTIIAFLIVWIMRIFSAESFFKITMNVKDISILFPLIIISLFIPFNLNMIGLSICIIASIILLVVYNWEIIKLLFKKAFIF